MGRTPSTMALPIGSLAPDFELLDVVSQKHYRLDQLVGQRGAVVMFICNHCPFVKHLQSAIVEIAHIYQPQGISFIAINSNDITQHPDDAPDKMQTVAEESTYIFPYLFDETQNVARAYQAACTPDFFVLDAGQKCVYRGRFDASTPGGKEAITGRDLRQALNHLLEGLPPLTEQYPSIGCSIKWKA